MITEQELFLNNQKLSTEFDPYLAEHPEGAKLYRGKPRNL